MKSFFATDDLPAYLRLFANWGLSLAGYCNLIAPEEAQGTALTAHR